jgi:hypothetical protein
MTNWQPMALILVLIAEMVFSVHAEDFRHSERFDSKGDLQND